MIGTNCTTLVEAAILGRRTINVLLKDFHYPEIISLCHNYLPDGTYVSGPVKPKHVIFSVGSGYNNKSQAEILISLTQKRFFLRPYFVFIKDYGWLPSFTHLLSTENITQYTMKVSLMLYELPKNQKLTKSSRRLS